jgi:hypothetical protein
MQKQIEEKLQVLKDILNGGIDFNILRAPVHYCVMQNPADGLYNILGGADVSYNEEALQQWLKTRRECDTVTIFRPAQDCAPLTNDEDISSERPVIDVGYTEVDSVPAQIETDKKPRRKQKPDKEPVNKPQRVLTQVIPKQLIHEGKLSNYGITWGSLCED